MNVEVLAWIAGVWVLLWVVDRVVGHIRWPHGADCCEHCVSVVDLANEGEETRHVLGDLLGRLDDVVEVLTTIRDAPEEEARAERERATSFRVSG